MRPQTLHLHEVSLFFSQIESWKGVSGMGLLGGLSGAEAGGGEGVC
jgi:hypothetical protein